MKKSIWLPCLFAIISCTYAQAQLTRVIESTTLNETLPEYPGGYPAFFKYLSKAFKFPKSVAKAGYMGPVIVTLIIDTDGRAIVDSLDFSNLESYRKRIPDDDLKEEAMLDLDKEIRKMFDAMPRWKPGVQDGRLVRVKYKMPYNLSYE